MKNVTRANGAHRTVRSRITSLVAAGSACALILAGVSILAAAPAGATPGPPTQLVFSLQPNATYTAHDVVNVDVQVEDSTPAEITSGAGATDVITLTTNPVTSGSDVVGTLSKAASGGEADFALTFNKATSFTLTANDTTTSGVTSATSTSFTVNPGTPYKIAFTTEPPTSTPPNTVLPAIAVSTEDPYGNLASSTDSIALTAAGTGCTITGTSPVSAVAGIATFSDIKFTGGVNCTLSASDAFLSSTASSTSVAVFGAATKLMFTAPLPPTTATLSTPMSPFNVSVEDVNGTTVTTSTDQIILTTTGTGCALSGSPTVNAAAGVASFTGVDFTGGTNCVLVATDHTQTLTVAQSASISLATSSASKLGFTTQPPSTVAAGSVLTTFRVTVEESNGIPISSITTGATDTIVLTSTCKLAGATSIAAVGGVATFLAVSIQTAGACTLVATDASRPLSTATSSSITVTPGPPTHVAFTTAPPVTQPSVTAPLATFKVSVEDVYNNVVTSGTGATDTVSITSPCTLTGTTSAVALAGVATFSAVTVTTGGACVLTATDTSRAITTATATTTVGLPQSALKVTSTKGSVGTALKLTTSGGSGTGAVTYAVVNGTATCTLTGSSLKANKVGTCLVTATKAASATYAVTSSAATTVTFGPAGPKATRVVGTIKSGRTSTVTVLGSGFVGRPKVISNVAGFSARVTRDTGKTLTIVVTVRRVQKAGTRVLTIILGNGKRTSVRYTLR